jgi:predicted Zn-dependent peptidase
LAASLKIDSLKIKQTMFKKTTFSNGLRAITVPARNTSTVTVLVLVGTGSKYETKETSGVSHFLEHLMFKGTAKRPTEIDVMRVMDEIGGVYNAFTGPDYTGYYAKVQAKKMPLAVEWTSDIFLHGLLDAGEIEKERGVIIEEINMFYDHPMRYIWTLWNKTLYGDQPAGWDIAGSKESVSKLTREDLFSYRRAQYTAKDTIVCVSGNFDDAIARRLVKHHFGDINIGTPDPKQKVAEVQTQPKVGIYQKATNQTQIGIGVRTFNIFDPRRHALELLGLALGGMSTSRIFEEVRIKRGLVYDVHTELPMDPDAGSLVTVANLDSNRLDEGIKVILGEYKKAAASGITAAELRKAKDNYIGKSALVLESSHALASFYAEQELLEGKIMTPKQLYKKIEKVTLGQIREVAADIFEPQKLNLALIGPYDSSDRFQKLLNSGF